MKEVGAIEEGGPRLKDRLENQPSQQLFKWTQDQQRSLKLLRDKTLRRYVAGWMEKDNYCLELLCRKDLKHSDTAWLH